MLLKKYQALGFRWENVFKPLRMQILDTHKDLDHAHLKRTWRENILRSFFTAFSLLLKPRSQTQPVEEKLSIKPAVFTDKQKTNKTESIVREKRQEDAIKS